MTAAKTRLQTSIVFIMLAIETDPRAISDRSPSRTRRAAAEDIASAGDTHYCYTLLPLVAPLLPNSFTVLLLGRLRAASDRIAAGRRTGLPAPGCRARPMESPTRCSVPSTAQPTLGCGSDSTFFLPAAQSPV